MYATPSRRRPVAVGIDLPASVPVADSGRRRIGLGPGRQPARRPRQHARGGAGRRPRPRRWVRQRVHAGRAWEESAAAEVFDPAAGTWSATESLNAPRDGFVAVTLDDGRALVTGGVTSAEPGDGVFGAYSSTKLYDPQAGTWSATSLLNVARYDPAVRAPPRWEGARGRRHLHRRLGEIVSSRAPRSMTPSSRAGRGPETSGRHAAGHGPSR